MQKKLDPYLAPYTKINSKWIRDLYIKAKSKQLLGENIRGKFHDIRFGSGIVNMTPKV